MCKQLLNEAPALLRWGVRAGLVFYPEPTESPTANENEADKVNIGEEPSEGLHPQKNANAKGSGEPGK